MRRGRRRVVEGGGVQKSGKGETTARGLESFRHKRGASVIQETGWGKCPPFRSEPIFGTNVSINPTTRDK